MRLLRVGLLCLELLTMDSAQAQGRSLSPEGKRHIRELQTALNAVWFGCDYGYWTWDSDSRCLETKLLDQTVSLVPEALGWSRRTAWKDAGSWVEARFLVGRKIFYVRVWDFVNGTTTLEVREEF